MQIGVLGIVGNTLFIDSFYGGDSYHTAVLSSWEKKDFIHHGVPEFPNVDHIDCQMHGMSYEEYLEYASIPVPVKDTPKDDSGLPF